MQSFPTREPRCLVAAACGGCPQIAVSEEEQRRQKFLAVNRLLGDSLGESWSEERLSFHSRRSPLGYRNRIRLRITESGEFGFFNREKDPACAVLMPELKRAMADLRWRLESVSKSVAFFDHVEIRCPDKDGLAGLFLTGSGLESASESVRQQVSQALGSEWIVGFADQEEQPLQRYQLIDETYQCVPLGGFMQVNFVINEALIESLVLGAQERGARAVCDLYCGSGNFLLPLLAAGLRGVGVEIHEPAIRAARRAAAEQGLESEWCAADVPTWLRQRPDWRGAPLAVVDPPRAGLKAGVESLLELAPESIAFCSCAPKSLARDLAALERGGYSVRKVELFDMFAHTDHLEALAWLERR